MKTFYFWYCIVIICVATTFNYGITFSSSTRSWGSSSGYSSTSSGWHK